MFTQKLRHYLLIYKQNILDNFTFIHINKTGGTSISSALNIPFQHKTALEKRKELGSYWWEERFRFAFVRNPWDRCVSQYFWRFDNSPNVSFSEWIMTTFNPNNSSSLCDIFFQPQIRWLTDKNQTVLVNYIGRFENIKQDYQHVLQKIGRVNKKLPHLKSTTHQNYRHYYTAETMQIVANWFEDDISFWSYQF
jgi:hypothetical protein